jgi:hypothetical protein
MQDNELMVHRTIQEFHQIYRALEKLFREELDTGRSNPLMRFMFTKFTTRLLSFRRRIQELLGYTGGESLEQISLSPQVCSLPIQSYNFDPSPEANLQVWGEPDFWETLPEPLKENPTRIIEQLPLYQRPFWLHWLQRTQKTEPLRLTIADLLGLGFDPTRLHEFHHRGERYIVERVSPALLEGIQSRKALLARIARKTAGLRIAKIRININPPLAWLQHRGNGYIFRKKVAGIHWEEAVSHLKKDPELQPLNRQLGLDGNIARGIREIHQWFQQRLRPAGKARFQDLAFFVPWNLNGHRPLFSIDGSNQPFLESVWLA